MTAASAYRRFHVPESTRRIGWRIWMVLRVPVYVAFGLGVGLIWAGLLFVGAVMYGWIGYIVGAVIGFLFAAAGAVAGADIMWIVDLGGYIGIGLALLFGLMTILDNLISQVRETSPATALRRAWASLTEEWREAADRWPSRGVAAADAEDESAVATQPFPGIAEVDIEPEPDELGAVDRAEPIMAYRGWRIRFEAAGPFTRQPVLVSLSADATWATAALEAACLPLSRVVAVGRHRVPDLDCACGIYAVGDAPLAWGRGEPLWAVGAVELTGRVLQGEYGFRAERARIVGPLTVMLSCGDGETNCARPPDGVALDPDVVPLCVEHLRLSGHDPDAWPINEFELQLTARLELRYGVDIRITKGEHQWT